ncbi:MAG TPA: flagellar hook-basal body complex protein FliE [Microthrixaceae bacterium]|nr:flagellar hook-basal body complex protein FliE [Microthrixaceae bacterium]
MPIPAIPSIGAGVSPLTATRSPAVSGADSAGGDNFASALTGALDNLDQSQKTTDGLARAAATGDLDRIEDLMVATTETQLATQLTVAVRNKAVEAFNDVMRMQL